VKVERRFKVLMLLLATAVQGVTAAQPVRRAYTLTVTKDATPFVTLMAQDAKLSDVAADLAKQLNAKVILGPSLQNERISTRLEGTTVEPAMLALAPRVLVDYEVRRDAQPVPLGIYLLGQEDPVPAVSAVVQGTSQGLLVMGNTEDTGKPPANAPLRITYDKGRLTVFAKQQPLIVVVMAIADELGVPAEIKYQSREIIDADVKSTTTIDETLAGLSENVRVYVRSDVNRLEKRLLRVVVVGPAAK
jgi:type II secretory pathway component GspD/PulD (secretin)